ncbi:MAG: CRISPR system precrRNA processing endoribonuclease RAMP protein Cas6 [Deltaproteobacteria bacterium]|nr:MAG: CRISPR system precrRNA processing endoribonuclease RAMP protein Cas6 [Deltaproteobacteria bacterium]
MEHRVVSDTGAGAVSDAGWMSALAVTRVDLSLGLPAAMTSPPSPSVAIRGALGAALWDIACVDDRRDCSACRARRGCPIPGWFHPAITGGHQARPFVVEVDTDDLRWQVGLWFFGVPPDPGLVEQALRRLVRRGVWPDHLPLQLESAVVTGVDRRDLLAGERWPAPGRLSDFVSVPAWPVGMELRLRSPTWFTGCPRRQPPDAIRCVKAAIMRLRSVAMAQGVSLSRWWPDATALRGQWADARFLRSERRSGRTGERIDLSGWVGTLHIGPDVAAFADLFAAMEVLHLGKNTSAGAGRLELQWPES